MGLEEAGGLLLLIGLVTLVCGSTWLGFAMIGVGAVLVLLDRKVS